MIPIETTYLKPRKFILYITALPAVILLATGILFHGPDNELLVAAAISFAVPLIFFLVITRTYVMIDNDGITYKGVFKEKMMGWKDVTRSYFRVQHTGKSSQRYWYFEDITGKNLHFSTGMYSRKSLQAIAEALVSKSTNAEIEPKIRNIAEGKFPWYIF